MGVPKPVRRPRGPSCPGPAYPTYACQRVSPCHGLIRETATASDQMCPTRNDPPSGRSVYYQKSEGRKETPKLPKSPCFICSGNHWIRDCPQKKTLNALAAHLKINADDTSAHHLDEPRHSMGSLQYMSALKGQAPVPVTPKKGLMFVCTTINGHAVRALLDTGASHNFIAVRRCLPGCIGLAESSMPIRFSPESLSLVEDLTMGDCKPVTLST